MCDKKFHVVLRPCPSQTTSGQCHLLISQHNTVYFLWQLPTELVIKRVQIFHTDLHTVSVEWEVQTLPFFHCQSLRNQYNLFLKQQQQHRQTELTTPTMHQPSTTTNKRSPGPRPTSIPSGIVIHPAVWPLRIGFVGFVWEPVNSSHGQLIAP